jgi:hypothetical protein
MAVLKIHSVDETKIGRCDIRKHIDLNGITNIRKKKVYNLYLSAIKSGTIIDPDKSKGIFAVRIDPLVAV